MHIGVESFAVVLKNAIDWVYPEWNRKAVGEGRNIPPLASHEVPNGEKGR